jgi:hypothetical protein
MYIWTIIDLTEHCYVGIRLAVLNREDITLEKALGTYLCWVKLNTRTHEVKTLYCYLELD